MNSRIILTIRTSMLCLLCIFIAINAEESGLDLYKRCQLLMDQLAGKEITAEQSYEIILITGYVSGFVDFHSIQQKNCAECEYDFCLPVKGISNEEIIKTVYSYIKKRPKSVELTARMLIMAALLERYPCRPPKSKPKE